ncbi:MAG: hypothetical protein U0930_03795 [Pirellulales bacterium]
MLIACPKCSRKLKLPDEARGKSVTCPACNSKFSVGTKQPSSNPEPAPSKPVASKPPAPPAPPVPPDPKPEKPLFDDDDFGTFQLGPPPTPPAPSLDSLGLPDQ